MKSPPHRREMRNRKIVEEAEFILHRFDILSYLTSLKGPDDNFPFEHHYGRE